MIRALVATKETQGQKKDDFSWTDEGEIVTFPFICDNSCDCGCGRAVAGIKSHKSTTTFKVAELDMTGRDFIVAIHASIVNGGWFKVNDREGINFAKKTAVELLETAEAFPVGTILEINRTSVKIRQRLTTKN